MPLIQPSPYQPNSIFKNGHFNTIFTAYVKQHPQPAYYQERLTTPDDDFFDIDWLRKNHSICVVLLHGFMGNSQSSYIRNAANYFFNTGFDICAINYRSASGENNRKPHTYHAGFTDDLALLVQHLQQLKRYKHIIPIGFSLGGSILLNYLCKVYNAETSFIKCAAAVSAPIKLIEGAFLLSRFINKPYWYYFKGRIHKAVLLKKEQLQDAGIDVQELLKADNFFKVDNLYTAKVFGFKDAVDYYEQASVLPHLSKLKVPTYLLNAQDDMMLDKSSYPLTLAKQHNYLFFEHSKYGGHLGFNQKLIQYYNERVAWFINQL